MNRVLLVTVLVCFFHTLYAAPSTHRKHEILKKSAATSFFSRFAARQFQNKCKTSGLMCKNCDTLVHCVLEDGEYKEVTVDSCFTPTESCLQNECSTDPNPNCPDSNGNNFVCTASGLFPDPYVCSVYHVCLAADDIIVDEGILIPQEGLYALVKCPEGWAYNPETTYCDIPLEHGICPDESPVPNCDRVGQIGPIGNTSIYYVCVEVNNKIRPQLYMCAHGAKISAEGNCE